MVYAYTHFLPFTSEFRGAVRRECVVAIEVPKRSSDGDVVLLAKGNPKLSEFGGFDESVESDRGCRIV